MDVGAVGVVVPVNAVADKDLIVSIQATRSHEAISELYRRHWPSAWRAAFAVTGQRTVADDVAQDSFLAAIAAIASFDSARPFSPWLHRIVVNRALNALRSQRRAQRFVETSYSLSEWETADVGSGEVVEALMSLPPERRAVVVLHYWFGYSTAEVAELVGTPVGTVYSRLGRAMKDLRERLEVIDARA